MSTAALEKLDPEVVRRLTASAIVQKITDADDRFKLVALAGAIGEAIKDMPHGIPSGHLYAALMGQMSLLDYQLLLSVLRAGGMIQVTNHLLMWVPE